MLTAIILCSSSTTSGSFLLSLIRHAKQILAAFLVLALLPFSVLFMEPSAFMTMIRQRYEPTLSAPLQNPFDAIHSLDHRTLIRSIGIVYFALSDFQARPIKIRTLRSSSSSSFVRTFCSELCQFVSTLILFMAGCLPLFGRELIDALITNKQSALSAEFKSIEDLLKLEERDFDEIKAHCLVTLLTASTLYLLVIPPPYFKVIILIVEGRCL